MGSAPKGTLGAAEEEVAALQPCATANVGAPVDKGVDFANYFCTYAFLYHQKEMLSDRVRMDAYYNAIFRNPHHFRGKVVLDVGTGSGILAIWCAQAGAKRVYAVEATKMSEHAHELVKANHVEDIVKVIEGSMEDVTLPEKVDVIISEWMGYFLLRESMFDSVICARDRWLKPSGLMYPSHARMWIAPVRSSLGEQKMDDFESAMNDWYQFVDETETYYGVNMNALTKAYRDEHEKYYLKNTEGAHASAPACVALVVWKVLSLFWHGGSWVQTSLWNNIHPNQVIGTPAIIKEIDCLTATVDEICNVTSKFSLPINVERTRLSAFAGWFDVHFRGSTQNPVTHEIELTTAPSTDNQTHWAQQVFLLNPPLRVSDGDNVGISLSMSRSRENHRLMDVEFTCELQLSSGKQLPPVTLKFYIE